MSSGPLSRIPSFVTAPRQPLSLALKADPRAAKPEVQNDTRGGAQKQTQPQTPPATQPEPAPEPMPPSPEVAAAIAAANDEEMAGLLKELAAMRPRLEAEYRAHAVTEITEAARALFPMLAHEFLAEEFARHLPSIWPPNESKLEIRVPQKLEGRMQAALLRLDTEGHDIEIVPQRNDAQFHVEIRWADGGARFEFATLLKAALERFGAMNPTREDV